MIIEELRKLTDFQFEYVVQCTKPAGAILFGIPVPAPFGEDLHWHRTEDGGITIEEEIEEWEEAWEAYINSLPARVTVAANEEERQPKRRNRTRRQAEQAGAITVKGMPEYIANVSVVQYRQSMTVIEGGNARLQPILPELADKLRIENGVLWFEGIDAIKADLMSYYDRRPQTVTDLDLVTLRVLYSIILRDVQTRATTPEQIMELVQDTDYVNRLTSVYLPDFMKMMGRKAGTSGDDAAFAIAKITSYNRILGCIKEQYGGRPCESKYTVLNFDHYDEKSGTLHFYSPYINKLIAMILSSSIQTDRQNRPKLARSGKPFLLPSHSYNIKASIAKERNKRAVEIVFVIDVLIAEAGNNHTPHIRAQTIIDRVPDLKYALDSAEKVKDKNIILKRAFAKAWELLKTQTDLRKNYQNIQFPTVIPTVKMLDYVFEFRHDGKRKKA